jgi:DNA-binding transcriptional ArsR family regulator
MRGIRVGTKGPFEDALWLRLEARFRHLNERTGLFRPTVSRHLSILGEMGLAKRALEALARELLFPARRARRPLRGGAVQHRLPPTA